ncbi:hypothetical protein EJ04DRAFT_213307 [Polyplosphaeria fusca]|uniref:Uncharacterized protein n=1 Tax=Polyplosphaeria fusca TaxID=682080 RepID=A0A9P4RAW3_9PLEO|nr:hypothetical protein EJ04DRAFT_213307 [Polyplosphaeria fusca]
MINLCLAISPTSISTSFEFWQGLRLFPRFTFSAISYQTISMLGHCFGSRFLYVKTSSCICCGWWVFGGSCSPCYQSTFTIFRLELHLPYFALRRTLPQHQHLLGSRVGHGKLRKPVDVSFLGNPDSKNDSGHWNIHHARFSLVVAGPNCFKWNAYAFVDTRFNETSRDDEDGDQPQTGQEEDSRDSYGMQEDPIASDGEGEGATVDAGMPIWDPRAYFLRNIGYRSQQAYEEWDHIFRHLDERIQQHDENHPHALCHQVYDIDPNESQVEFAWTVRTMNVLRMLRGNLKTATSAFDRFCAPDGDINYFIDLMEPRARSWLEEVRDYTGQLTDLVQKFFDLDESLRERCRHLELRMSVDSNRLSLESNKLSLQSNKLSSEGHALNLSAHSLTLEAKQLTRETYQVNLEMSEVAYENQRTNYLSLSMNQIWLPISIAIAYFGTPQETFPFKRTPAMMLVCVVGIMIGANLFVLLLIRMRHTKWYKSLWKWLQTYRVVRLVVDCVDGKYAHSENTRSARASAGSLNSIELTPNV